MPHRSEYVIICGANLLASHTADYLIRLGCKVTLVVPAGRMTTLRFARTLALERIVEGDCRELDVLRDAGLPQATAVLLLHDSDLLNIEAALKIREQRKRVRIVSRIFQRHLARSIDEAIGHHYSLSDSVLAAPAFALAATLSSYAGYFYLEDPAQPTEPLQLWEVAEIELDDRHPLVGKEPKQLELEHATLVVARRPASEPQPEGKTPIFFPPHDTGSPLRGGERIMVLARPDRARTVLHTSMPGPTNLWGNKPRRRRLEATLPGRRLPWHRSALERMLRVSPVMKLVGAALAALLVLGMATFAFAGVPGADTLFYTIVVLTGGYGDLQLLQHPATSVWVKAVASALTMLGAGLVGLVYGVMTEQVLGRSLGTILLDRRIPRQGHVIVCGLGNIGVRVVEELHRMGIPVVVIEKNHENPHMHAVRRLKIPVIESSAASPGVLTRARVEKAHCLVGATDDDLANLDVALAARALCDQIRVVLRVFDQGMVQPLQKMFGIDVTYSVWMLAAPAFAAAALVGRTFGSFRWKQRSVLVQELIVPPDSPIVGHPLEQVCEQYDVRAFFRGRFLDGGTGQASIGIIESGARVVFLGTSDAMRRIANVARPADDEAPDSEAPASTVG